MNLIVKMKFGAHLYGTATADSDVDYNYSGNIITERLLGLSNNSLTDGILRSGLRAIATSRLSQA